MLRNRYSSLVIAILAAAHFGCGGCGDDETPTEIAPEITSEPVTEAFVGEDYRYHVDVDGDPEPEVTAAGADGEQLPLWLAFDEETNTLLGQPSEDHVGLHEVVITATNDVDSDVQSFEIEVMFEGVAPEFTSDPITEALTGEEYEYFVDVTGLPEPAVSAEELPDWLSFDADSVVLAGTPDVDDIGEHDVVLVAINDVEPDAEQAFTINVEQGGEAPVISSTPPDEEILEGETFTYEIEATGFPEPVIAAGGAGGEELPEWLELEDNLLFGVPGLDDVGEHDIIVTATNNVDVDEQEFTIIVVRAPVAPSITSTPDVTVTVGEDYVYEVTADGYPEPEITALIGDGGVGWLSFDADTHTIAGSPEAQHVGEVQVEVTAENDAGTDTQAFTIEVESIPPVITSTPVTAVEAGEEYVYEVTATGNPAPTFSFTGADWLVIDESTGVLSGTPGYDHVGDHDIEVTATNEGGSDTQAFQIEVTADESAPVITSTAPATATVGEEYLYEVEITGFPVADLTADGLPEWLEFDGVRTISGFPTLLDVGETGDITLTATNDEGEDTEVFTITVEPADAIDVSAGTFEESFGTETPAGWSAFGSWQFGEPVVGPDSAFDGDYLAGTILDGDYPSNDDSWLITPPLDFTGVAGAAFQFHHWYDIESGYDGGRILISTDGGEEFMPILEESIEPESSRYDATAGGLRSWSARDADEGWRFVSIDLEANLLDGDGNDLDRDQVLLAFNFTSDSSVQEEGWYVDAVSIGAADDLPASPSIVSSPDLFAAVGELYTYEVVAEGDPDPALSATGAGGDPLADWLSFDAATGILEGTPDADDLGEMFDIEIVASNAIGEAVQSFTIEVLGELPEAPAIVSTPDTTAEIGEEYVYVIDVTGSPEPDIVINELPVWLEFDGVDTISGTANLFAVGDSEVSITATNGIAPDAEQEFTITVDAPDAIDVSAETFEESFSDAIPAGWSATGDWEIGEPTSGPEEAYDGDYLAATVLDGDYTNIDMLSSLLTPVFDLSGVAAPMMQFVHWHDIDGHWDGGNIKISTDGGSTFAALDAVTVTPEYTGTISDSFGNPMGGELAWGGSSDGWRIVEIDLEANLDGLPLDEVVLRFDFGAEDWTKSHAGWYVDAVTVGAADDLPASPSIVSSPDLFAAEGVEYEYQVEAEGSPEPDVSAYGAGGVGLPSWLAFDPATGILFGTPQAAEVGEEFDIEIVASNGFGEDAVQEFTISVLAEPAEAPEITSTPATTAEIDVEYSYTIEVTGSPEPEVSVTGLPGWLSFDDEDGTISGTPSRFDVGEFEITVTATNGVDPGAEQVFTIVVDAPEAVDISAEPISESFETGETPAGWHLTGDWEIGEPTSGPEEAFEGDHLAATNLDGNYSNSMHSMMLSPVMDLTDAQDPFLRFVHWYDIESGGYDGANVKISTDGGASFVELDPDSLNPAYSGTMRATVPNLAGEGAWWGESGGWEIVEIDLGMNLDADVDQVVIRFDMGSDGAWNYLGWYVDSIDIAALDDLPPMDPIGLVDIAGWDFEGETDEAYFVADGVTVGPMTHALGATDYFGGNPGDAIATTEWDGDDNYWEFEVTPDADVEVQLYSFMFDDNASGTGPNQWEVFIVQDDVETPVATGDVSESFSATPMNVVVFEEPEDGPYDEPFKVRIRGYDASGSGGTWRIDNVYLTGWVD